MNSVKNTRGTITQESRPAAQIGEIMICQKLNIFWPFIVDCCRRFISLHLTLGGERNRKQRIPVNSITSKLVLKSIYASGSTGPFFADHYLNIWIDSTQVSPRKTDFLSRYLVLSEIRYARKRNWSKAGTESSVKSFVIFLKSLKSLNKNFY